MPSVDLAAAESLSFSFLLWAESEWSKSPSSLADLRGGLSKPEVGLDLLDETLESRELVTFNPGLYADNPFVADGKVSKENTSMLVMVDVAFRVHLSFGILRDLLMA